ncbi:AtzE family amidohydrolase [Komagataeibacter sp. AV436]|uniref:AtzE family amidohydrolase n=1 Tax=Komagataeibacter melomenusus TaxID=2766578 RepID=A0ABX2AFA2_9PROT|nr:AtzE family amidohydrolase [Komagataeibacter melomenusus]MBV1830625.1 AtzE family amidohydrolase [Komagataeibacter melomenusus]NPC66317.1 AtzE family amidohydrolase [Komagataeibacter melomenusus]
MSAHAMGAALGIAADIRAGRRNAVGVVTAVISDIEARDTRFNSVTRILGPAAVAQAEAVDKAMAAGQDPGPLAGVPFGVKDLFDVRGEVTTAGSIVLRDNLPATEDATVIARLRAAGAVPVATLNMDEFAYGFSTENAHNGTTRNPHDRDRLAGGSSGGSAAAVAAGLLPFTLGSDTNGSIRIPSALCGVWGLKPTYGQVPLRGVYPFVASLDTAGPMADTLEDLMAVYAIMAGRDVSVLPDVASVKVARLGGWFARNVSTGLTAAIDGVMAHLGHDRVIELPEVARARASAFLISAAEGGNLHLPRLRRRSMQYDPATRSRLMAGAMLPAATFVQAQRFRRWFRAQVHEALTQADVLVAPTTVGVAPRIDQPSIMVDGKSVSARANLGIYTQPISLAGLPVLATPLAAPGLPLGIQLIGAPGAEAKLFAVAAELQRAGLAACRPLDAGYARKEKAC